MVPLHALKLEKYAFGRSVLFVDNRNAKTGGNKESTFQCIFTLIR